MIMENRRMKVREIAEAVGISTKRVHPARKISCKKAVCTMVPRLLTLDQKRMRKDVSMQCLAMFKRNPQDFWRRFVWTKLGSIITLLKRSSSQSSG